MTPRDRSKQNWGIKTRKWPALFALAGLTTLPLGTTSAATLDIESVRASASGDKRGPRPASAAIDGRLDTRWSANGVGQWIEADLGRTHRLDRLDVAWFKGHRRSSSYEVQVSDDGRRWRRVAAGRSSGKDRGFEAIALANVSGRYVRIVGLGNSINGWNSINELRLDGVALGGDAVPPTQPLDDDRGAPAPRPIIDESPIVGGDEPPAPIEEPAPTAEPEPEPEPTNADEPVSDDPAPAVEEPTTEDPEPQPLPSGTPAPSGTIPVLVAGPGFDSAIPPATVLSQEPGGDETAIARWDVVPYQEFESTFTVGVLAFHINGIERVDFSLDGGPWASVAEPTLNPRTGVNEYTVALDPARLSAGPVKLRAVAVPKVGLYRALPTLTLNADGRGELPNLGRYVSPTGSDNNGDGSRAAPFRTVNHAAKSIADANNGLADGGTIYLLPGEHVLGGSPGKVTTKNRWLTVTRAAGVAENQVKIVGTDSRLKTRLFRVKDLTYQRRAGRSEAMFPADRNAEDHLWIDGCELIGNGRLDKAHWYQKSPPYEGIYVTDTSATNSKDGFLDSDLQRNVRLGTIGSDAFSKCVLVINSSVDRIDKSGSSYHADVYQFGKSPDRNTNVIIYGLRAEGDISAQGLFCGDDRKLTDVAVVNSLFDNQNRPNPDKRRVFQISSPARHFYVLNNDFVGIAVFRTDVQFAAKNVVLEDNRFLKTTGVLGLPSNWDEPGVTVLPVPPLFD